MSAMNWKKGRLIGQGGSSTVYECFFLDTSIKAAVKEIHKNGLSLAQMNVIQAEIDLLKALSHPNVIQYMGTEYTTTHFYIFLEYAEGGSLRQLYLKHGAFDEVLVQYFLNQILSGLHYLHLKGIAHRDIKGANILITEDGIAKLADFGSSKKLIMESLVSGIKGTPHFMAPEVIRGTQATTGWYKADVWSVGCLVIELSSGALPFAKYENSMTVMFKIASGESPPMERISPASSLHGLVEKCCSFDPSLRPSVEELLSHPFLSSHDDGGALSRLLSMMSAEDDDDDSDSHGSGDSGEEGEDLLDVDDDEVTICATIIPSLGNKPSSASVNAAEKADTGMPKHEIEMGTHFTNESDRLISCRASSKYIHSTSSSTSGLSDGGVSSDEISHPFPSEETLLSSNQRNSMVRVSLVRAHGLTLP